MRAARLWGAAEALLEKIGPQCTLMCPSALSIDVKWLRALW